MNNFTGAHAILQALADHGVTTVFWYPWWAIMPLYDAIKDVPEIEHILVRHEQAGIFAAQWWARTTGKIWVAIATSWPWATNTLTWLLDAHMDSIPVLLITWQVASGMIGKDAFQELDAVGATMSMTKHSYLVKDVQDLPCIVHEAIHIATHGRPGPVHIDIPKDICKQLYDLADPLQCDSFVSWHTRKKHTHSPLTDQTLAQCVEMVEQAERPLLLVWQWVKHAWAEELVNKLVATWQIPTVTTLLAKWVVRDDLSTNIGILGMHWWYHANMAVHNADLIMSIWSRFDDRIVWNYDDFAKNAKVIHVDIDASELNKCVQSDLGIHSDARVFLDALFAYEDIKKLHIEPWLKKIADRKCAHPIIHDATWFTMKVVYETYNAVVASNLDQYAVITDVWQHQMRAWQHVNVAWSRNRLTSWWAWSMWFAIPAAMWWSFAWKEKTMVAFIGDGCFQMSFNELQTIAEHGCNVKMIILNNSFLWMVRQRQELFFDKNYASTPITSPNYQVLAKAFNIPGYQVTDQKMCAKVLQKELHRPWPCLIECVVQQEENVFPMVPAGKSLGETMVSA